MPTRNAVHVDAILSNISIAYMQSDDSFIASRVFPNVPVEKASGLFYKYNQNDWLRDEAQKRADTTESAGSGYTLGQDSYSTDVWAFHKDVGDQVLSNTDSVLSPITDATNFVASRLLLRQERDFSEKFFKAGVWSNNLTGTPTGSGGTEYVHFDDYASSDPIGEIEKAKELVAAKTGFEVNTIVLGKRVFLALKNHPEIIDRIKYTSSENVTTDLIARLFDIDRLFVGKSLFAANKEGAAADTQYNFSNGILLTHSATAPGLLTPSAGYTFTWNGISDGTGLSVGTRQFRLEEIAAERIESQVAWDNKVVAPDLGVFLANAVS